ncbi:MAG TPA: HNH endonuclease signature motif containing protein [Anaeromyxobacteraceae bacterium]|nr:HNH endonuclease signature motif containing protein [Anaeromyxobacteraceae bacterium]
MHDTRDLTKHLAELLRHEHGALADFLVALADFDRDRRWVELGHTSLFYFLHRELGLSKGAAFYRKTAAELIQRYPEVVEPLRDGRLCITSVVELAKVITPENRGEVVARFFHTSKQEAKAVAAELRPAEAAPHRDVVTVPALAAPAKAVTRLEVAACHATPGTLVQPDELRGEVPSSPRPPAPLPAARPDEVEPLTGDLRRFHTTVSKRFLDKLAAARDALSHSHPGADTETVLEAALDLLLAANDKKKGIVKKPRPCPARPSASPRHIPADVKRAVWTRDGGCCRWPLASGGVCGSTTRLEFDHIVPLARGGTSTVSNLRVLCDAHNQLAARQVFGEAWMDRFASKARGTPGAAVHPKPR